MQHKYTQLVLYSFLLVTSRPACVILVNIYNNIYLFKNI